ncbi:hypothetical protein [Flavobacterium sp. N3904]|uniref:hypothetical protein n=1 Tax=Flavobacterium sp. N3904 TaxID=2986835 RepID=UPI002225293E|nr:hypothetical protein [Flavobacterium sp. N3904]
MKNLIFIISSWAFYNLRGKQISMKEIMNSEPEKSLFLQMRENLFLLKQLKIILKML